MTDHEKQVDKLVDLLGCSIAEAEEIIATDSRIDKGEKLFEQTADQKKAEKQMRAVGTRTPTVYKLDKRPRKADEDKRKLVELLAGAVNMVIDGEPTVTNAERQIDFEFNGRKFRIVLSAPRN